MIVTVSGRFGGKIVMLGLAMPGDTDENRHTENS